MKTNLIVSPNATISDLRVEKEVEINGIGMGVLSDGTAYLTARGLARLCGADHTMILDISKISKQDKLRPRENMIREILTDQGYDNKNLFIPILHEGSTHHAFPEVVCMAILEYYAFEAKKATALSNYRILSRKTLRDFIYTQVGYDPRNFIPEVWKQFHDRVTLVYDNVPPGYFSVFKELADIIVTLIRSGAKIGDDFVPDISVGLMWGKKWNKENLELQHGKRITYKHNYPDYFPQAKSNPQTPYCCPDSALATFRSWMRETYLTQHFPNYLKNKVDQRILPASSRKLALSVIEKSKKINLP
ncbi:MAG: hypothetical protein HQL97_05505 [Magnetococcales bacterium]|nr:hypothetical protein [Magnetococcales bacterium]